MHWLYVTIMHNLNSPQGRDWLWNNYNLQFTCQGYSKKMSHMYVIMEMRYLLFVDHVINRRTGKTCHKGAWSGGGGTGASREAT